MVGAVTPPDPARVLPDGVSVALLTPVAADGTLDLPALDRLVARARQGGVAGLSPAGSTGEGARLSAAQRLRVVSRVVGVCDGLPVIAGVPCRAPEETHAELCRIADAGAAAALIAPPGPYRCTDDELASHVEGLADRSPLPLVLYHIPALAPPGFSPALVARLAAHERIVGMKDSSRDLEYLRTVLRRAHGLPFRVVTGTDALLTESLAAGAAGAIAPSPCVAPGWAAEVFRAWAGGAPVRARGRQDALLELVTACRAAGFPAGWKAAAAMTGVCGERPVPPGMPVADAVRTELRRRLERLGLTPRGGADVQGRSR